MKFKIHVIMTNLAFYFVIKLLRYLDQYLYETSDQIEECDIIYWIDRDRDCFEYRIKNELKE